MKLAEFFICVLVVVLMIGFVEYMAKIVRNHDDNDDWDGHWPY